MSKIISFKQGSYQLLYYRYKNFIVPLVVIMISIFVFINFVIPQINDFFSLNEEQQILKDKIAVVKKNIGLLSSLNDQDIDKKVKIISLALPIEKDFAGVINSISKTANSAGVSVEDYSFIVGELSTKSAQMSANPSIRIVLRINGDIKDAESFLRELDKSLPVSEVTDLTLDKTSSNITAVFYYSPFSSTKFNEDAVIQPLSKDETNLISKISAWYKPEETLNTLKSSISAETNPFSQSSF